MTPATLFIVAISLGFCGLVAILCGLIGQPALDRPLCRSCRRDVRDAAWSSRPTCVCGAALTGLHAVRWSGRIRSRGAMLAGILLLLLAGGMVSIEWGLRARQLLWQDLFPASYLIGQVRRGEAVDANLRALGRRAEAEWLDVEDRRAALEAMLSQQSLITSFQGDVVQRVGQYQRLLCHPSMMGPEDADLRSRVLAACDALHGAWSGPPTRDVSKDLVDPWPFQGLAVGSAIVVVEELTLNERRLPYRIVIGGRGTESRVWIVEAEGRGDAEKLAEAEWRRSLPMEARRYRIRATEYRVPLTARWTLSTVLADTGVLPEGILHTKREHEWLDPPAPANDQAGAP